MAKRMYKTVTRTQGNNLALKEGRIKPATFDFDFEEVPVLVDAFRRMVRRQEFDICEMALTTYLCAKAHGKPFTALPIFLVRGFHHGAILINRKAGIARPKDLEGKRIGVNRGYTVTTGVWARGILQDEGGIDLNKVTWVLSGDEHVAEYQPPANVIPMEKGRSLSDMLIAGELAATIGVSVAHPDVVALFPDASEIGLSHMKKENYYPINHLVVVRDDLLAAKPGLGAEIFDVFARSKRLYIEKLRSHSIGNPTDIDRMHMHVMDILPDPLPYGIVPNTHVLEELMRHAIAQHIIDRPFVLDDIFAAGTQDLVA